MNRRGQLPIILALILSGILITSALLTYKVSVFPKRAEQSEWVHVILNAEEDFHRILQAALANFTQEYIATGNMTGSQRKAEIKLETWKLAFTLGYSGLSLRLNLKSNGVDVSPESSYKVSLTYDGNATDKTVCVPGLSIAAGHFFNCSWNSPCGISAAYASISLDIIKQGLYGWNSSSIIFLTLNITSIISDSSLNETRIEFTCSDGQGCVNRLNKENVTIHVNGSQVDLNRLEYTGMGGYIALIGQTLNPPYTMTITVRDGRGIAVRASLEGGSG